MIYSHNNSDFLSFILWQKISDTYLYVLLDNFPPYTLAFSSMILWIAKWLNIDSLTHDVPETDRDKWSRNILFFLTVL